MRRFRGLNNIIGDHEMALETNIVSDMLCGLINQDDLSRNSIFS